MTAPNNNHREGIRGAAIILFALVFALATPTQVSAQNVDPSDAYMTAYLSCQDAAKLEQSGDLGKAGQKYASALQVFESIQREVPTWRPDMIKYRIGKIRESINQLGSRPVAAAPTSVGTYTPPVTPVAPVAPRGTTLTEQIDHQLHTLQAQIQQLQGEKVQMAQEIENQKKRYQGSISEIAQAKNNEAQIRVRMTQLEEALKKASSEDSVEADALREERETLLAQIAKGKQELATANEKVATANGETAKVLAELEESKKTISEAEKEAIEITKERDQMAIMVKAYESGSDEAVKQLISENRQLQEELQQAIKSAENLEAENAGKDAQIAQLKTQVEDVRGQLAGIREQNATYSATIADLNIRLKATATMLANDESAGQLPEALLEENRMLKDITVRQLRQSIRQQKTNVLVIKQLENLEGSSDELLGQVKSLVNERPALSDDEQQLLANYGLSPEDDGGLQGTILVEADTSTEGVGSAEPAATPEIPAGLDAKQLASSAEKAFYGKDFAGAERYYEEFIKTDPTAEEYAMAMTNLGVVRMRQKKFKEAEQALAKARALSPDNSFTHFNLGMAHYWQGRNDDALLALESATTLEPDLVKGHHYTGVAAARLGEFEKAEREFLETIALDPRFNAAHFNLAVIYATRDGGKEAYDLAEQHYMKAIDNGSSRDPLLERILNEARGQVGTDAEGEEESGSL